MLDIYDDIENKDVREFEIDVNESRKIRLKNFKGLISIRGWEEEKIKLSAIIDRNQINFGEFDSTDDIDVSIQTDENGDLRVSTSVPKGTKGESSGNFFENLFNWIGQKISSAFGVKVNYELFVPYNYNVFCDNTNGHCYISDITGDVSVKLANGNIEAENLEGNIYLVTYSGKITLSQIKGNLEAKTYNGKVSIIESELDMSAIKSMNGRIMLQFIPVGNGKHRIKTMNGRMMIGVPPETSASFSLKTMAGKIMNNLEGTYTKRKDLTKDSFVLGTGNADIAATTMNGNIYIVSYDEFDLEEKPEDKTTDESGAKFKLNIDIPADSDEYKEIKKEINEALEEINHNLKNLIFFDNDEESDPQTPEELNDLINRFNAMKEDFIKIFEESDFEHLSKEEKDKINREINIMHESKLKDLEKDLQNKVASFKDDMKDVDEKFSEKLNTVISSIESLSEKLKNINIQSQTNTEGKTIRTEKIKRPGRPIRTGKKQETTIEEETKMILKMLEEGKINASEAEALIKALKD